MCFIGWVDCRGVFLNVGLMGILLLEEVFDLSEIFVGVVMSGIEFEGVVKGGNGFGVVFGLCVENVEVVE